MLKKWQEEVIAKSRKENLGLELSKQKDKIADWENQSGVMAMDPSGTSTSAIFYYQS